MIGSFTKPICKATTVTQTPLIKTGLRHHTAMYQQEA